MIIIPAIDIIGGKCVRLTRGNYKELTVYSDNPLEAALQFEDAGLTRLHLVDLDGAKAGTVRNWKVLERIAAKTSLNIDFSGGISSQKQVNTAIDAGAKYIAIGSLAVKNEMMLTGWLLGYGADRFIIGADVKEERIFIKGWTESTTVSVFDLIKKYRAKGIKQFFCTDINKDGLLSGPSFDLYKNIMKNYPDIELIASGGISSIADIDELKKIGCKAAIIGKAFYENKISLKDLQMIQ